MVRSTDCHLFQLAKQNIHLHIYWQENQLVLCHSPFPGFPLISPSALEPIQKLKTMYFGSRNPRLHTDETLIALSISASTNPAAQKALDAMPKLRDCQLHCSNRLSKVDLVTLRKLGLQVTMEPVHER